MFPKIKHFTEFKFFMSVEMKPHVNVVLEEKRYRIKMLWITMQFII